MTDGCVIALERDIKLTEQAIEGLMALDDSATPVADIADPVATVLVLLIDRRKALVEMLSIFTDRDELASYEEQPDGTMLPVGPEDRQPRKKDA